MSRSIAEKTNATASSELIAAQISRN